MGRDILKPCGLDKLRIYIGRSDRFTPTFRGLREKVRRPAPFLEDYREFSLPVVLKSHHPWYGCDAPHVLDFMHVGQLSAHQIVATATAIIAGDALKVRIGLIDLTADWRGGTVSQCRRSFNIQGKHRYAEWGVAETIIYGSPRSGNFFRVYDKTGDLRKRGHPGAPSPWVRVEHHLSGRSLPKELCTLGGLLNFGASYEPFASILVNAVPTADPIQLTEWHAPPNDRRNAVYTLILLNTYGQTLARKKLTAEGRKPHKEFDLLKRALAEIELQPDDMPDFNKLYRLGFVQQLWPGVADASAAVPITSLQAGANHPTKVVEGCCE